MLRNVLFPLLLIILSSTGTIYFWFDGLPSSLFGLIGFLTLGLGSMYLSYYIAYKVFPDKRNKPLPPIQELMAEYSEQKGKQQAATKGSVLGSLMAIVMTVGGIYSWTQLADEYKTYELEKYGKETHAVIIDIGQQKGIGTYREFEYQDGNGKRFRDKFSNKTFKIGDTIMIVYSTNRPVINKITTLHNEQ